MTNIILAHGFNVNDGGKKTTDKLIPYFPRRHTVQQADYGFVGFFGVRLFNDNFSALIAGMSHPNSTGIGHSNGAAILCRAAKATKNIDHLILINPALNTYTKFPKTLKRIDVFHNNNDEVVKMSAWLPWHEWGKMGNLGSTCKDKRVYNHEMSKLFNAQSHSDIFSDRLIHVFADYLNDLIGACDVS